MSIKKIVPLLLAAVLFAAAGCNCSPDSSPDIPVAGISISQQELSLEIGASAALSAAVTPDNASDKSVIWSSSDEGVATVTDGMVQAVALGAATVTVTSAADSSFSAVCRVTVAAAAQVTGISLSRHTLSLEVGASATLTAAQAPPNAAAKPVVWSTSDAGVATVTDGSVKAIGAGVATVTVKLESDPSKLATCLVTVADAAPGITMQGGAVAVGWKRYEDAVTFDIYRAGSRLGEKTLLGTTGNLAFTDNTPNPVKYENYYTVVAKNAAGQAIVGVKWNFIDNAVSYCVERASTPDGTFTEIATVSAREFVDRVPNYVPGQTTYRINPLNADGEVMKGSFDTDSAAHTVNAANARGYSITRNIVVKEFYPQVISFEREMFGEDVYFYDAQYDKMSDILRDVNRVADAMRSSVSTVQMSAERHSFYFKPGEYPFAQSDGRGARLDIGFYMTVAGLGLTPTQTRLGGTVYTPPALAHSNNGGSNATHNFWRAIENFEIYRPQGASSAPTLGWAVSQAAPMRRIATASGVGTNYNMNGGWGSGGFAADIRFGGGVSAGGQQQWYTRNCDFSSAMSGVAWNNFAIASTGRAFTNNYMTGGTGTWVGAGINQMREKPFLYYDTAENEYKVFVPALRQNALGVSWSDTGSGPGRSVGINDFYIAKPGDTAAAVNARLAAGKNILYTPGMYECEEPVLVKNENAVVLGTGMPSLYPGKENGEGAMLVSDVSGVTLAGFVVDAFYDSKYLLRVGEPGSDKDHSDNPTFISDVFARVGGFPSTPVNAEVSVDIHSNDVIGDHFWIWLADHGRRTGWTANTGAFGLIVHGDRVTMHGLFVEHYNKYQTLWLGEAGEVFFYQNELPYTVPNQEAWMSNGGTVNGWAAFKVANHVDNFHAVGFGCYSTLRNADILLNNAYEAPNDKPSVKLEALYANNISNASSGILNVINDAGGRAAGTGGSRVAVFENGVARQYRSGALQNINGTSPKEQDYQALIAKIY